MEANRVTDRLTDWLDPQQIQLSRQAVGAVEHHNVQLHAESGWRVYGV